MNCYFLNLNMTPILFKIYRDYFMLLNNTLDQNFLEKYKSFIDEHEEEQITIQKELKD